MKLFRLKKALQTLQDGYDEARGRLRAYGYSHVRALFKLPCRTSLQKYVGKSTGEVGITPLIKERLRLEREGLVVEPERMSSLIIDEMAIQQKVIYDRQVDKIFGLVDMGPGSEQDAMATPRGEQLSNITAEVMKLTEEAGFRIVRVVTDNHQTNVSLFKSVSDDGTLSHVVTHPVRVGLKLGGQQEEPLYATDDERLLWLEVDFINYIEDLQLSGSRSKQKITKETYEATLLTTRFRYVLIRGFNSDPVESFFSCLRQFNGGNDRVDARAAVFSVEKLLKVGILHAAKTANVSSSS
ncbi:hypothetical protein HPB49_014702 [Dermacentor silvarum]|uniref:Uncharacterized protein n=1 Tax=Dermacentor silvarum TaxID=543639 RepID=A0ACB8DPB5_DERSI|nr:hypothetical protein HPB49_014702 [Dermacentor silvarum]